MDDWHLELETVTRQSSNHDTLGSLIPPLLRQVPGPDDKVAPSGRLFEVLEKDGRRDHEARVSLQGLAEN